MDYDEFTRVSEMVDKATPINKFKELEFRVKNEYATIERTTKLNTKIEGINLLVQQKADITQVERYMFIVFDLPFSLHY